MEVTITLRVADHIAERYWELYDEAFAALRTASPCRQALTEQEFHDEMVDERILKFVLWDGDEAVAMSLMATDLAAVPWISPEYFAARYPEHFAERRIYYFGALLTAPHQRRAGNANRLLRALIEFVGENRGVAAFDCAEINARFLPELIRSVGEESLEVLAEKLDAQHYYGYTALGVKSERPRTGRFTRERKAVAA